MDYTEANALLAKARDHQAGHKIANNTWIVPSEYDPEGIGIRLHNTEIMTVHPDDSLTLRTGGWETLTTKERLNRYLPPRVRVYQENRIWYLNTSAPNGEQFLFEDGMRVSQDGAILSKQTLEAEQPLEAERLEKAKRKVDRLVRKYIKGFCEEIDLLGRDFPDPGLGDCWCCSMVPQGGDVLRDDAMGVDHYFSHFAEKYYVPSLLWKALQRRGNPSFVWGWMKRGGGSRMIVGDLRYFFGLRKVAMARYLCRFDDLTCPELKGE